MIFVLAKPGAIASVTDMKTDIYIPPSTRTAEKHLSSAFKRGGRNLSKLEFVRAWASLAYLYPGLHPEGFDDAHSGWPRPLRQLAVEAWRRFEFGELTENGLIVTKPARRG